MPDIESFLELRENTGDTARRTYNLNLANWIPDLFMQRVEADGLWSLFDPKDVPELPDLFGDAFTAAYEKAEAEKKYHRQIKARELYLRMMRSLAETGNGWMTFKDATNLKCNQTGKARQRCPSFEPVHRDHRGDLEGPDCGVQSWFDQPRAACHD